jgi:hypothetical protein
LVTLVSEAFLRRFGLDSRDRLTEIAEEFGIDVLYRPAESYDGALLRIRDAQRGCIVINSRIREESRKRFTLGPRNRTPRSTRPARSLRALQAAKD